MSTVSLNPNVVVPPEASAPRKADVERGLRKSINEFVGLVFYGQLLKAMRNSPLKSDIGHGGRGEDIFAGQLDIELSQQVGRASGSGLSDAIYRRLRRGAVATRAGADEPDLMRLLDRPTSARAAARASTEQAVLRPGIHVK